MKKRTTSSTLTEDGFTSNNTYELNSNLKAGVESEKSSGLIAWKWIVDHWEVPSSILVAAGLALIFITKLDSKVEVLTVDVKDVKTTVEKLSTESTRTNIEVGLLQKTMNRLEEKKLHK